MNTDKIKPDPSILWSVAVHGRMSKSIANRHVGREYIVGRPVASGAG